MKNEKEKRKGNYGHKQSEATKQKIRDARAKQKMKPMSDATKLKISKANKGKPNVRKGLTGFPLSDATKRKISENNKAGLSGFQKGNQVNKGRKLSQDHKDKITKFNLDRWQDPKYRKHMLKVIKVPTTLGTKQSPETIAKRMKTMKPIFESSPYKAKLREKRLHQTFPQKDSKIEIKVQLLLDMHKIRYDTHVPITGQPDILVGRIAIFIDGCWWHNCKVCHPEITLLYHEKLKQSIYDLKVNHKLNEQGYNVIRIWEHDINSDPRFANNFIQMLKSEIHKKEVYHGS